jgi:YbbR domain-containing protein
METKISKDQILIRILCIIVSFILWLYIYNVKNPIKERKIVVPVNIVNKSALAKSNLVQIDGEDSEVTLDIKGNVSEIYSIKSEDFSLECDIGSYVLKKGDNNVPVEIKKQPKDISIVNSENLWVSVKLDSIVKKTLPIELFLEGETKEGLNAVNSTISVKQAEVSGASKYISNVNKIAARYNIENINKSGSVNVALQAEDSSGEVIKNVTISPKYVRVNIQLGKVKSVPVSIKTTGTVKEGTKVESISCLPDKVTISGNKEIISSINSIDTETVDLSKVSGDENVRAKLSLPIGVNLVDNNKYVNLKIDLTESDSDEKISKKNLEFKIKTKNLSKDYEAQLEEDTASIVVSGESSIIDSLKEDDIECYVDLSSVSEGEKDFNVNVTLPDGVSIVSKNPQNVKVTIKKKSEDK